MVVWGKFALQSVTLNQDLSLTLDAFYIEYLRYALADQICQDYGVTLLPGPAQRLKELESIIMYIDPPDLTNTNVTMYPDRGWNYADVSIGHGWRT